MSKYRKLIAAAVGVGVMLLATHVGIDLTAQEESIVQIIIGGLTAAGVWAVPNEQ